MGVFDDDFNPPAGNTAGDPNEVNPSNAPAANAATDYAGPDDVSTGKHAIILVPDFTNTLEPQAGPNPGNPLNSYLRLGAAHSQAGPAVTAAQLAANPGLLQQVHPVRTDLGEDLASMVVGFTDDIRDRGTTEVSPALAPDSPVNVPGLAEPPTAQTGEDFRIAESGRLHLKGGWRDHSDGNRITTTRGDKVEVIRGNYKLLVLGRTDDIDNAVGFDMSGGQIDTDSGDLAHPTAAELAAGTAALDVTWQWVPSDSDGKGRWHVTTNQGSVNPIQIGGLPGQPVSGTASNPSMTTTTFAFDYTTTLNAHTVTTNTTTDQDNDTTTRSNGGSVNNTTLASSGTIHNHSSAQDLVNESFATVNIFNETAAPLQETLQQVGLNTVFNVLGGQVQVDAAAAGMAYGQFCGVGIVSEQAAIGAIISAQQALNVLSSVIAASTVNNVTAPIQANCFTGTVADIHMPLHIDNHAGVHIDNHAGAHVDVHMGLHFQTKDDHTGEITMGDVQTWLGPKAHMFVATNVNLTASTEFKMAGMTVTM